MAPIAASGGDDDASSSRQPWPTGLRAWSHYSCPDPWALETPVRSGSPPSLAFTALARPSSPPHNSKYEGDSRVLTRSHFALRARECKLLVGVNHRVHPFGSNWAWCTCHARLPRLARSFCSFPFATWVAEIPSMPLLSGCCWLSARCAFMMGYRDKRIIGGCKETRYSPHTYTLGARGRRATQTPQKETRGHNPTLSSSA